MIASLSGRIRQKTPGKLIIETGGIGFGVMMPLSSYYVLPEIGKKVTLLIHTHIREDAFNLFGFITPEEKKLFEKLINISGIGPKLAINILSGITASEMREAVLGGNISRVKSVPGVGKKTAERIILELKDKMNDDVPSDDKTPHTIFQGTQVSSDAISALINLGYKEAKAEEAVRKASRESEDEAPTIEELIKKSLNFLSA